MEQKTKILIRMANFFSHKVYYNNNKWLIVNKRNSKNDNGFCRYSGWIKDLEDSYPNSKIDITYGWNMLTIELTD